MAPPERGPDLVGGFLNAVRGDSLGLDSAEPLAPLQALEDHTDRDFDIGVQILAHEATLPLENADPHKPHPPPRTRTSFPNGSSSPNSSSATVGPNTQTQRFSPTWLCTCLQ